MQFALCEGSKYLFYLRFEAGPIYKPSTRDFEIELSDVVAADAERLNVIWDYWENEGHEDGEAPDDNLHPDHRVPY